MAQSLATQHGGEPSPLDTTGLCLLSLDGGGVRGLSTLYILKGLMARLNHQRQSDGLPRVKPCEVFDLIGGTSTGGLIAIMLGRLEMDVDACIASYSELMKAVFEKKSSWLPLSRRGKVKARFDSVKLKNAVDEAISKTSVSSADAFNDGKARGCRTFVCATAKETAGITRLRSYTLPDESDITANICEAALATSAATGFFDPVLIGARQFVDGALGANNPVDEVEGEAANIWSPGTGDLKPLVKCFISIGTGHPGKKALEDNIVKFLSKSLVGIATETEETERKFIARWAKHYDEKRYFRFNVDQGLQEVGLAEYKEQGRMQAATDEYLRHQGQKFRVRDCVENLQQKQNKTESTFELAINEHTVRCITRQYRTKNEHWMVPQPVNSLFTGRSELIAQIQSAVRTDDLDMTKQKRLVITGMGGMGKSEVCLRIANEIRQEFWAVFWVDVGSPDIARSDFVIIGDMLGQKIDSVKQGCRLLDNIRERCLLILDNADDPTFDYSVYLPSGMRGAVLVASRCTDLGLLSTTAYVALQDLSLADCTELLLKVANIPREQWTTQAQDAENVVHLLQSHTLALIQAGAYVARGHCKLEQYPEVFKRNRQRLLQFGSSQAQSRYRHVYATFEASAAVLSAHALDLLGVLSMMNHTAVLESVFESAWRGSQQASAGVPIVKLEPGLGDISAWEVSQLYSVTDMTGNQTGLDVLNDWHVLRLPAFIGAKENTWDAYNLTEPISLLSSLSLITRTVQDGANRLSMHPLVHAWARDRQSQETREVSWLSAGCVITLATRGSTERAQVEHSVQAHIQSWIDEKTDMGVLCGTQKEVIALVWSCSWMLVQMRDDARLERLLEAVFQEAKLDFTQPTCFLVPLYHLRAQSYCLNGKFQVAVELMESVVRIRQETLDWKHRNRVSAEHLLGVAYQANGQTKKAVELLKHVVKVHKTTLAETHPDRLASQHELASAYRANGQTKEAVELLKHVVKVRETTLAEIHPDRLASQHELARAYRANRQTKEAIELLKHVVKVWETTLAETHPDRLASQHELARAYRANRQTKEAVELLKHVVKTKQTTMPATHPSRQVSERVLAYLQSRPAS